MRGKSFFSLAAAVLLAVMTLFGAANVYADSGDAAISIGPGALKKGANTSGAQLLKYGGQEWYVIDYYDGGQRATLLSKGNIDHSKYGNDNNQYGTSVLKEKIEEIANGFNVGEQGAVKSRTLTGGNSNQNQSGFNKNNISGADVDNALLWPLSVGEAEGLNSDIEKINPTNPVKWNSWWLRSPGNEDNYAASISGSGYIEDTYDVTDSGVGVRPAFYLNLQSVLFTSAAAGGKSSADTGPGALQEISVNSSNEWKVTVKEADREFDITECWPTEEGISFRYTGAKPGENEYISAIITDADDNIKYYGRIAKVSETGENGEAAVNTAEIREDNDKLFVFNEQLNGDNETDFGSELKELIIPKPLSFTVSFNVENGSWNDGTTGKKDVTLTGFDYYPGYEPVLTAAHIPAVGNEPAEGYKPGSWEVRPRPDTVIMEDTSYTYSYDPKEPVSCNVTFKVVNGSWDDATSEDKVVTLTGLEGDELKLGADKIPAVGNKPAEGYKAGSWDMMPSADTAVTEDTTFTYTFAVKGSDTNPEPGTNPEPVSPSGPTPAPAQTVKNGQTAAVSAGTVKVVSAKSKTVRFIKAKNRKSVNVPATVKIKGQVFKITEIGPKAFKGKKIRTVTIGKNVKKIMKNAFKGSKAAKMIVKTKMLTKSSVKGSLKGSKIKTVKVKVGKKYVKKYKKIFTKKNAGRKVKVK